MKIARPSEADIDAALKLLRIFNTIEGGLDPTQTDDDAEDEWLDLDDEGACRRVLRHILDSLPRRSGLERVVWGMATVCDPQNAIIDPDSDALELHPSLRRVEPAKEGA